MKLLELGRGRGKTTTLIQWAKSASWTANPTPTRVIVTTDLHQAARLIHDHGVKAVPASNLTSLRGVDRLEVAIDELDDVLSVLIGAPVVVATRTGEK